MNNILLDDIIKNKNIFTIYGKMEANTMDEKKKFIGNISKKKIIIICSVAAAIILIVVGFLIWKFSNNDDDELGLAFVSPVSDCNTAVVNLSGNSYSGVVESQKALEVKVDADKIIKDINVKEGDDVEEGDELFTYDVEAMKLELEEGKIEIERINNEIESNKKQIKELETEKKSAGSDAQVSYTTQIQSLETDNDKLEYDIKVKKVSQDKLENSIKNSSVKAEIAGTIKALKTTEEMTESGTDVIMNIVTNSSFRIKGKINEQNIGSIMQGDAVIVNSRVDDTVSWNGTVSEISNEPEANNDMMYMDGDSESSSSNYAFYVEPENIDGLKLGQHVLISIDYGQSSSIEKTGIWLYDDYLVADGENYFVWAAGEDEKLEKRYVEIGQKDENNFDSEILSGLEEDDLIAYPSDDYQEGMKTTTNIEDIDIDDEMPNDDMIFDENAPEFFDENNPEFDNDIPEDENIDDMTPEEDVIIDDEAIIDSDIIDDKAVLE